MSWLRLHSKPKMCRNSDRDNWTPKQRYKNDCSFRRYSSTEDGLRVNSVVSAMIESYKTSVQATKEECANN